MKRVELKKSTPIGTRLLRFLNRGNRLHTHKNLERKAHYAISGNIGTILRSIAGIRLGLFQGDVPVDMFIPNYLPYKTTRIYRTIMTEFECKRSEALVEARRQNLRTL